MERSLIAVDVTIPAKQIETDGTAFYRIDPQFRAFLLKCDDVHGVIGFSYDFEILNFGVVLASSEPEKVITADEKKKEEVLIKDLKKKEKEIKKKGKVKSKK